MSTTAASRDEVLRVAVSSLDRTCDQPLYPPAGAGGEPCSDALANAAANGFVLIPDGAGIESGDFVSVMLFD